MYKKILLAYDGSQEGRAALKQGAELAAMCKADVCLMAVLAPDIGVIYAEAAVPSDLPDRMLADIKASLEEGKAKLKDRGLEAETRLENGIPANEIGRVAQDINADLIVVGHREQSALSRWWGGSTGASLLAHAPCSILIAIAKDA
ncbi:universal stress protein UspA [Thalassospira profundimaris]|uniref:Universal stress protein UspA n=1 Tax=Thalassospira profundimaris TaxID=502049 RepID=A0A367X9I2_9PROT|nr:universal stress protein [Thalassospira profundimaris]RCK50308.1 universal stress protein UspA [Thalassospira profundimaris]